MNAIRTTVSTYYSKYVLHVKKKAQVKKYCISKALIYEAVHRRNICKWAFTTLEINKSVQSDRYSDAKNSQQCECTLTCADEVLAEMRVMKNSMCPIEIEKFTYYK